MYPKLLSGHPKLLLVFPSLSSLHSLRNYPEILSQRLQYRHSTKFKPQIKCITNSSNGVGGTNNWEKWMPRNLFAAEKVFGAISGATSSPIAQYISSPTTFLHCVDPRIKMAWLLALVILPAKSNMAMRLGVVICLALLSIWIQPTEVWKDQLGRVTLLCGILFVLLGLSTDSAPSLLCSRSPPSSVTGLPTLPASLEGYKYVIMKLGPLQLTRKGLSAASTAACLTFTIFQSASLCLTTTTSEQLAFALQWYILPLANLGVPVAEIILTLLLSLRFINLVFDEVRNVALGIVSRRIQWQQLTTLETIDVFFTYIRRIFKNIYSHAAQISQAMIVRGFRGDCRSHQVLLSAGSSRKIANIVSFSCLVGLICATTFSRYLYL
ncbi:protein ABCI12, chloroplastic [Sesamum indicum]|uniref:Protein ABCI12, chloroplastic n=1 Tax=Sesamum indicum TaxID=4182 RepID=A0A6I9SPD0_SESIN|nr:protein ABCI12, chloroplastic [Sesamum indicum]